MSPRRGPDLPYTLVAGATPWGSGWVVASAKQAGATFAPERLFVYGSFLDVLGERPAFSVVVINAPIGYRDTPEMGPRSCETDAKVLLEHRRATIHTAPSRAVLSGEVPLVDSGLDAVTMTMLPRYREVALEMSPYRQRTVYEGHPEMSFYQLNKETSLTLSKRLVAGQDERREILAEKVPGIEKFLDDEKSGIPVKHRYDASALLWTARRVLGRAAKRVPLDAEWDSEGLRMEIVY